MKSDDSTILTSWKEIAGHLDVTVRTAQLWEKQRGLPVRRMPGPRSRVYMRLDEYEAWLTGQEATPSANQQAVPLPVKESHPVPAASAARSAQRAVRPSGSGRHQDRRRRPRRAAELVAAGLLAGVVITLLLAPSMAGTTGPPASGYVSGDTLIIEDGHRVELWRKQFEGGLLAAAYPDPDIYLGAKPRLQFVDVDGDGTTEVLFAQRHSNRGESDILFCFSATGEELWRFVPGADVAYEGETFPNLFHLAAVVFDELADGRRVILTSGIHYMDEPTQIAVLSAVDGSVTSQYWHSGHIGQQANGLKLADLDGDGRDELYAGGISNARRQATVVVLDPDTMRGASEEPSAYQLVGFETGTEIARIFLPRTTMNRIEQSYNSASSVYPHGTSLQISVEEHFTDDRNPTVVYELTAAYEVEEIGLSDFFHVVHRAVVVEQAGGDISAEDELEMLRLQGIEVIWPGRRSVD